MRTKKTTSRKGKKGTSKTRKPRTRKVAPGKKAVKKVAKKPAAKPKTTRARRAKKAAPAREPEEQPPAPAADEALPASEFLPASEALPPEEPPQSTKPEPHELDNGVTAAPAPETIILFDVDEEKKEETSKKSASGERSNRAKPNRLVPTSEVHPTERRVRRRETYGRALVLLAAVAVVGLFVLSDQGEPPDVTAFEQPSAIPMEAHAIETAKDATSRFNRPFSAEAAQNRLSNSDTAPALKSKEHAVRIVVPFDQGSVALQVPSEYFGEAPKVGKLSADEITEMERMLTRLDLGSNPPDGIFDTHTASAIRLYQQIAGLRSTGSRRRHCSPTCARW